MQRGKRKERNGGLAGYVSNFTNYDDMKSDSANSNNPTRFNKPVTDASLRKLLLDPNINEAERMNAVKIRTEQIEQKAKMEEQKLRLMRPVGQSNFESIDQSMAVNDIYIDSI